MAHPAHIADLLLKIEYQLKAYQQLHEGELAELWKALDECKRTIVSLNDDGGIDVIPAEVPKDQDDISQQDK